jgi:hypothetical protein
MLLRIAEAGGLPTAGRATAPCLERYCFSISLDNEHCFIVNTVLFTNMSQTIVFF